MKKNRVGRINQGNLALMENYIVEKQVDKAYSCSSKAGRDSGRARREGTRFLHWFSV